jgi:hypothetical protein
MRPEELSQLKNPMTSSRNETATFGLLAQCLNQLHDRVANTNFVADGIVIHFSLVISWGISEKIVAENSWTNCGDEAEDEKNTR